MMSALTRYATSFVIASFLTAVSVGPLATVEEKAGELGRGIESKVYDELAQSPDGRVYVIILLEPTSRVGLTNMSELRAEIGRAQDRVLYALPEADFDSRYGSRR